MKQLSILFGLALLTVVGCKKEKKLGDDYGCMNRVTYTPADYTITPAEHDAAIRLFNAAGISTANLRFTNVVYAATTTSADTIFHAEQYVGMVCIFTDMVYHFTNGLLSTTYSVPLPVATAFDTINTLKLSQIRKLYIDRVDANTYKDSCLRVEFGYSYVNGNVMVAQGQNTAMAKTWRVRPPHADYPVAYIKDDGTVLYFDNGIRTL